MEISNASTIVKTMTSNFRYINIKITTLQCTNMQTIMNEGGQVFTDKAHKHTLKERSSLLLNASLYHSAECFDVP